MINFIWPFKRNCEVELELDEANFFATTDAFGRNGTRLSMTKTICRP
jgi:hypothetical protein